MRHQYGTSLISGDGVVGADTDDIRWLTYAELGRARGISTASANRLAFRRKWRRQTGNDGIARVAVPMTEVQPRPDKDYDARDDNRNDDRDDISHVVRALEAAVASLTERAATAEKRADRVEIRAESAESRAHQAERDLAAEQNRADRLELAQNRLESELETAKIAQGEAEADAAEMHVRLVTTEARAKSAEEAEQAERKRADTAVAELRRAEVSAHEAVRAAEELRQADAARRGQGRWQRLRAAWRGD
jgi:chromosome segregation ATPase